MCYCPTRTLHLNLALTGDFVHFQIFKKEHFSMFFFLSLLFYGDIGSVLINHLHVNLADTFIQSNLQIRKSN